MAQCQGPWARPGPLREGRHAGRKGLGSQPCGVSRACVGAGAPLLRAPPLPIPAALFWWEREEGSGHPQATLVIRLGVLPDQPAPPCLLHVVLPPLGTWGGAEESCLPGEHQRLLTTSCR